MQRSALLALLLTSIATLGCTSSNSVDSVMAIPPSQETTASVRLPRAPVPGEVVGLAEQQDRDVAEAMQQPLPPALDGDGTAVPVNTVETVSYTRQETQIAALAPQQPAIPDVKPKEAPQRASLFGGARNAFSDHKVYPANFRDAHPVNFGKASPHPFEVHGVDVSHWQGNIDWKKLRTQGANFAFIKATEGGKHVDRLFRTNWDNAHAAGIPTGAYHFMYWCRNAEEQAKWFIRNVPKQSGSLPPVLDVEWNGNKKTCPGKLPRKQVLAKMKVWLDIVERHYGVKPIIYTAPDFYEDNLKGQFTDYSFWLRSVAVHPKGRYPNREFAFWQYSGTGLSKGVSTEIDLNVFNGTEESWKRWLSARVQ